MINIVIPFKTPTINHLYGHRGFRKYLKPEAKKLREMIEKENKLLVNGGEFKDACLKVKVEIHEDWYTKKGTIKRKDISNREKFLIDSVFTSLGLDDKQIFNHTMIKVHDKKEYTVITIEKLK